MSTENDGVNVGPVCSRVEQSETIKRRNECTKIISESHTLIDTEGGRVSQPKGLALTPHRR